MADGDCLQGNSESQSGTNDGLAAMLCQSRMTCNGKEEGVQQNELLSKSKSWSVAKQRLQQNERNTTCNL